MKSGKKVLHFGRWRIALMYGGRYRFGFRVKRLLGRRIGFDAGLGVVVVSAIQRSDHA